MSGGFGKENALRVGHYLPPSAIIGTQMSKLVFILGAGCSVAAGAPTMPRFLDVAESISRSKKLFVGDQEKFDLVFKAYDCLQSIYSKSSEIDLLNIESLFA